jgi:hypothetical protein
MTSSSMPCHLLCHLCTDWAMPSLVATVSAAIYCAFAKARLVKSVESALALCPTQGLESDVLCEL